MEEMSGERLEQAELLEDSFTDRGKMDCLPLISDKISGGSSELKAHTLHIYTLYFYIYIYI